MTPQPAPVPAISWRRRTLRRTTVGLGAAVVLAAVGPALANAAGADVANPVAIALRASGEELSDVFGAEDEVAADPCVTPTASEVPTTEPTADPSAEPSAEPSVEPSVEPTDGGGEEPSAEPTAEPSAEPLPVETDPSTTSEESTTDEGTTEPSAEPTAEPTAEPADGTGEEPADDCAEPAEETPVPSEEPAEAEETEDADGEHGRIVSTVAKCAPKGKDPLLDVEGAPANHGGYVKPAAHGDTLSTPWGEFDLSTQAGADALCASFEAARAALPDETAEPKVRGKKDKAERAKPAKGKPAKTGKGAKPARGAK
ncbi:MAG TPA: hypothetical protein VNQ77_02780 [Frankiaceae bacterium]|nr:hypothetical protein [Frankiaceae bacterium]